MDSLANQVDIRAFQQAYLLRPEEAAIAKQLYTFLREFDDEKIQFMYAESFDVRGMGQAIMNRLLKAAGHKIIKL